MVMIGLSVANVVGVPAATWMGQHLGWRSAFWVAAGSPARTAQCSYVDQQPLAQQPSADGEQ
jgi:predicted MFS family arabinose efflux permease